MQRADIERIDNKLVQLNDELHVSSTEVKAQLTVLTSVCTKLVSSVQTSSASHTDNSPTSDADRPRNVIITVVAEDRDRNVWFATVQRVLHTAATRDVQITDTFRV
jgi:hypothetical protein